MTLFKDIRPGDHVVYDRKGVSCHRFVAEHTPFIPRWAVLNTYIVTATTGETIVADGDESVTVSRHHEIDERRS